MTPEQQWLEIQVRLVAGEATETPFRGVVEVLDDESDELVRYRVRKDRHRWRVETEDGSPRSIQGDEHRFTFVEGSTTPGRDHRRSPEPALDAATRAIARPLPADRFPGDFTEPASAPERTTHLGRDAWRVSLLPPPHKEVVLVETFDSATGMLLDQRTERYGPSHTWLEIEPVEGFDVAVFTWDGDFHVAFSEDDVPDDFRDQHEEERARSRRAETVLGPSGVTATVALDLEHLHVAPGASLVDGTLRGEVDVHFLREDVADPDERQDLAWRDDAGRTWSLRGDGASPAVLAQVRDWLERRAPGLDEL